MIRLLYWGVQMLWTNKITLAVSIIGAMAAIASAWIGWRVYKRQIRADEPTAEIVIRPHSANCWNIEITVQNSSDVMWSATDAEVLKPGSAKIVSLSSIPKPATNTPWDPPDVAAPDPDKMTSKARMHISVRPRNTHSSSSLIMGSGDRHSEALFLVTPPSKRSIKLSMRLNLASNEAVQRKITIPIMRTLIADMQTAKD